MCIFVGVFVCFALIIMETKVGQYIGRLCHSLDPMGGIDKFGICEMRNTGFGYSVPIAWVSFSCCIITSGFWFYIARGVRLERSKALL